MLPSSSSSSVKSAKICLSFNKMFSNGTPSTADKEHFRNTTLHPSPYNQQYERLQSEDNNGKERCSVGMSMNGDYNDYLHNRPGRLSGGRNHHHYAADKLILSPSQCKKQQPAGLESFDPKKQANVINLQLNDVQMKPNVVDCMMMMPQRRNVVKSKTRATQTLFRESSAQTLPYLPGVSNDPKDLETLEIFKLPAILPGDGPPGLYEVEVLERSRKRWAFAKSLKENFRQQLKIAQDQAKLQEHEHILEAFEWEHWIEREEYIQECQMLRFELLICMFDKREHDMQIASKTRIEKSCEDIEAKRKAALRKNEIEYNKALRRLEIKHNKQPRKWRKQQISQELGDPSSEFYAPKMRYGVSPSRRHFTASHKGFNMRMDDLEKKVIKMDPKSLRCPFSKLKEWSKPKEVLREVEQNFCSDAKLNKLYESLRALRETSRKQKYIPACLKAKEPIELGTVEEEKSNHDPQIIPLDNNIVIVPKPSDDFNFGNIKEQNSINELEVNESYEELCQQKQAERLDMELRQTEMRCEELETLISSYEGNTIGWLMRFLSEEMCRLKEQRKLHFFAMLTKRERWHREAAEAGLRQKENCMRDVYEKLYKEYEIANKETTNQFLDSLLSTDIKDYSRQKAEQDVGIMARDLDKEITAWLESFGDVQNPLNYHTLRHALKDIVVPDVEKILNRFESNDCINYIINDVLLCRVYRGLESYDISFDITSNLVDRLVDNDLCLNSPSCSSEFCDCTKAQLEAKAIIRKVIRYAVPGRRWRTDKERVAVENVHDLLDDVFCKVITSNCFIEVDMADAPYVRDQRSHTDLADSKNDLIFEDLSEETTDTECQEKVKSNFYNHRFTPTKADNVTKSLKSYEKYLLPKSEKGLEKDILLHKDEYISPGPKPELSDLRKVPNNFNLSLEIDFCQTLAYTPTSSENDFEEIQLEEEVMSVKDFTKQLESKEEHEQEKEEQGTEIEIEEEEVQNLGQDSSTDSDDFTEEPVKNMSIPTRHT